MKALLLKAIGFPLIGVLASTIFLFLTFPEDKVQLLVQRHIEKALDYDYRVEAVEFEFGVFSGIEMKQVTMTPRFIFDEEEFGQDGTKASAIEDGDGPEAEYFCPTRIEPSPVLIDAIRANPSLSALLSGGIESTFELEAAGGSIAGAFASAEDGATVTANIDNIALQRFTLLRNKLAMHVIGLFGGDIELGFGEGMSLDSGSIDLRLAHVVICPKKFDINMPNVPFFEMPLTRMGEISGRVEVAKGRRLEFKNFQGEGEDMDLDIQGFIQLANEHTPRTRYDVRVRLTPHQQWIEDNAMQALFKICKRFDDGSIQIVISGESGKLKKNCVRAQPGDASAEAWPVTRRSPPPAPVRDQVDDDSDTQDEPAVAPTARSMQRAAAEPGGGAAPMAKPIRGADKLGAAQTGGIARSRVDPMARPVNASSLKGRVKPVPRERSREVLKVYDR